MALSKDRIFKTADGHIRSGKIEKAVTEYEKWVAENPKDWNTIRQIGDLYARIGRNDQAIKKYTQIAEYYRSDGFNVRAIATYKMILRLDPQNESSMANLAELQVAQGLLMEAKSQYQALVERYSKSGKKQQASGVFKKLAEIDPSDLKVRYKYAEFLERQGRAEEAIAEYSGIAEEFVNKGLVSEAIQIMEKGLRVDPNNRSLRCRLAHAAILQGDYAKAITMLEGIRAKYPTDVELLSLLGEAYQGAGNVADAEAVFLHLAELEPNNPDHAKRMSDLALGQDQFDKALESITPAVDKFVSDGEGEKAAELLQKILNRAPHHVETLLKLTEMYTVLKHEPARISAYDKLCEAYTQASDYEKAAHVADQLIRLEPENSQHKDRLRFLKSQLHPSSPSPPSSVDEEAPSADLSDLVAGEAEEPQEVGEEYVPSEPEIAFDEGIEELGEPNQEEIEAATVLSPGDNEHISEKLTEAEVFVRYGLVDKAIDQLKEVLRGYRFHTGSREKLIEIYKDQGMNHEAAEQAVRLARVYEQLGQSDKAEPLLKEAAVLDPALAGAASAGAPSTEEEIELTLTSEDAGQSFDAGEELVEEPGGSLYPLISEGESEVGPQSDELTLESAEYPLEVELAGDGLLPDVTGDLITEMGGVEEEQTLESIAVVEEEPAPERIAEVPAPDGGDSPDSFPVFGGRSVDSFELDGPSPEPSEMPEMEVGELLPQSHEIEEDIELSFVEDESDGFPLGQEVESATVGVPRVADASAEADRPVESPPDAVPAARAEPAASIGPTELAEVDEYIALGLYEDAQDSLAELLKKYPGNAELVAKIDELGFSQSLLQKDADVPAVEEELVSLDMAVSDSSEPEEPEAPEPLMNSMESAFELEPIAAMEDFSEPMPTTGGSSDADPFADLESEITESMFGTQSAVEEEETELASAGPISDAGLNDVFREFKKGVEKQLGTEDYDTRYNLGIAYKEMGLLDEAIAEFQLASKDESRLLECCSMLGLCFLEKGIPEIAIKWFQKGFNAPGHLEEEYHGLRYDLAQAHEAAGDTDKALELYMNIYRDNARFRDVTERVRELQSAKK